MFTAIACSSVVLLPRQKSEAEAAAIRSKDMHGTTKESCHWLNAILRRFFVDNYDNIRSFLTLKIKEEIIDVKRFPAGWIIVRANADACPCTRVGRGLRVHGSAYTAHAHADGTWTPRTPGHLRRAPRGHRPAATDHLRRRRAHQDRGLRRAGPSSLCERVCKRLAYET